MTLLSLFVFVFTPPQRIKLCRVVSRRAIAIRQEQDRTMILVLLATIAKIGGCKPCLILALVCDTQSRSCSHSCRAMYTLSSFFVSFGNFRPGQIRSDQAYCMPLLPWNEPRASEFELDDQVMTWCDEMQCDTSSTIRYEYNIIENLI